MSTTLTISTTKPVVNSGRPVNFKAVVSPNKGNVAHATGAVTWTIVGQDGSTVACSNSSATLSKQGKANCSINKAILLAAASPYTVTATYAGDANYSTSTSTFSETVNPATTHVKVYFSARPSSGAATTVYARVSAGVGTKAITGGTVVFSISVTGPGKNYVCGGIKNNNSQAVVDNIATCTLPAGWIVVPTMSKNQPKPRAKWGVTAVYFSPTSSFTSGTTKTLKGTDKN